MDLNRNYGLKWGVDDVGSSPDPCSDIYRGAAPFSEKESQTIRNLIAKSSKISSAVNFHAYGNLWIHPFSFANLPTDAGKLMKPDVASFYARFRQALSAKGFTRVGTAEQTIRYLANGDASDWMLGEHGIVSLSPELGALSDDSDRFFLSKDRVLEVLKDTDIALGTWFGFHLPFFEEIKVSGFRNATTSKSQDDQKTQNEFEISIHFRHSGIVDLHSLILLITFESKDDALRLQRVEFNDGGKIGVERDESQTKARLKTKLQVSKLSENRLTLHFTGAANDAFGFQFFKLNKEVATFSFDRHQVGRLFGRSWFQSDECRGLIVLLSVLFVGLLAIKLLERLQQPKAQPTYVRPADALQL